MIYLYINLKDVNLKGVEKVFEHMSIKQNLMKMYKSFLFPHSNTHGSHWERNWNTSLTSLLNLLSTDTKAIALLACEILKN